MFYELALSLTKKLLKAVSLILKQAGRQAGRQSPRSLLPVLASLCRSWYVLSFIKETGNRTDSLEFANPKARR
jgi:hypothetical protein